MPTAAREYVRRTDVGDLDACIRALDAAVTQVAALNRDGQVANCYARVVRDEVELFDEGLRPAEIAPVTGGRFPFLLVSITYDPARVDAASLAAVESTLRLAVIYEGTTRINYFN